MPNLDTAARWFIISGLALLLFGALLWILSRSGWPIGRLPGDLRIQRDNLTCFIPLASSILLSILLTLALNLIARLLR